MDSTCKDRKGKQEEAHSRLPFSHRRRPKRDKMVSGKDCLSTLPLELFLLILRYTDDIPSKHLTTLKSLSMVNKDIRAKCISAGLFQSLFVTLHRGTDSIRNVCYMLRNQSIAADYVHTLTITEYVIGECPSELARLLQLLRQLKTIRIKGNRESKQPLNCGRLISFNGMLYKTFSSRLHLTKLEKIEIINMSITQIIIDIIAAIPRYHRLELRRTQVVHAPDLMTTKLCNPIFLHMQGDIGKTMWMYPLLRTTKIARSIRYFCLHADTSCSLFAFMRHQNALLSEFLPALKTLHLLPPLYYGHRSMTFVENLRIPNVVGRYSSSLRQQFILHQWYDPPVFIVEIETSQSQNFIGILKQSFETFIRRFAFHQSAQTIIYHSNTQLFGIQFLKPRKWRLLRDITFDNLHELPLWYLEPITINDLRILEREEIEMILNEADRSQWPKLENHI